MKIFLWSCEMTMTTVAFKRKKSVEFTHRKSQLILTSAIIKVSLQFYNQRKTLFWSEFYGYFYKGKMQWNETVLGLSSIIHFPVDFYKMCHCHNLSTEPYILSSVPLAGQFLLTNIFFEKCFYMKFFFFK